MTIRTLIHTHAHSFLFQRAKRTKGEGTEREALVPDVDPDV